MILGRYWNAVWFLHIKMVHVQFGEFDKIYGNVIGWVILRGSVKYYDMDDSHLQL